MTSSACNVCGKDEAKKCSGMDPFINKPALLLEVEWARAETERSMSGSGQARPWHNWPSSQLLALV